jgi:hypothetical protein
MHDWLDIFTRMAADELGTSGTHWLTDWMTDGQADAIARVNGRAVARYGRRVKIVLRVLCEIFAACTIVALCFPGMEKVFATPFAAMGLASAWCLAAVTVEQIDFDRTDIHVRRLWRDDVTIPWSAIESVGYSDLAGCYLLEFGHLRRVRVGISIGGCGVIVHMARAMARENRDRRR